MSITIYNNKYGMKLGPRYKPRTLSSTYDLKLEDMMPLLSTCRS